MPQFWPQQRGMPQVSRAGQADSLGPVLWAAGALIRFSNRPWPHEGHEGVSSPRTNSSNSWPQFLQAYS